MQRRGNDSLKVKTDAWLNGRSPGDGYGVLFHLALRRVPVAMTELARKLTGGGATSDPFSSAGLAYRAYRQGDAAAAYNQAMECFNRRDLKGYRQWLRRAAKAGDADAAKQLGKFETRLPHGAAHDIKRGRPSRRND